MSKQRKNEQIFAKKRRFLTVHTRWLDSLMTSKNASFRRNKKLSIIHTNKPFCRIGRIKFSICPRHFGLRSDYNHAEWMKQANECSGRLDELTRSLHSAWLLWRHNRKTVTEFHLLAFYWLATFTCWLGSFGQWRQKKWVLESRHTVFTISILDRRGFFPSVRISKKKSRRKSWRKSADKNETGWYKT